MRQWVAAMAVVLVATGACSADPDADRPEQPETEVSSPPTPTAGDEPSAEQTPEQTPEPSADVPDPIPAGHPQSLPTLMGEEFTGSRLQEVRVEATTDAYTRSQVTYRSGDVTVSGVLLRPRGTGPFPGIVLNHGYIDPDVYVTGQGLAREQDWLARAGFVVLHTDYRGHAASDPTTPVSRELRLDYTRDAINAVRSLEREPYVDADRMAMLGRSMGGGITLNALVAQPGLVDAAVVYASVSSSYLENFQHFTIPNRPDAAPILYGRFGTPQESPAFYRGLSSRTYFDRITEPVLMHHGSADEVCPFPWARTTQRLLERAGVDSQLEVYDDELHAFVPQWQDSIERTVQFLERRLG